MIVGPVFIYLAYLALKLAVGQMLIRRGAAAAARHLRVHLCIDEHAEGLVVLKYRIRAAADDDEENILACIMAKRLGAKKTISVTHKPEYIRIVPTMEMIDSGISSTLVSVNLILRILETGTMRIDAKLQRFHAHLTEFTVSAKSPLAGKTIMECKLPPTVVLALLFRGADVIPPAGTTVLIPGDVVVAIVNPKGLKDIEPFFPK